LVNLQKKKIRIRLEHLARVVALKLVGTVDIFFEIQKEPIIKGNQNITFFIVLLLIMFCLSIILTVAKKLSSAGGSHW